MVYKANSTDLTYARPSHVPGLQRYPDKCSGLTSPDASQQTGILLVDSEKQELMGEKMTKCKGIYVPSHHVRIFLHDPQTFCYILISAQIPTYVVC